MSIKAGYLVVFGVLAACASLVASTTQTVECTQISILHHDVVEVMRTCSQTLVEVVPCSSSGECRNNDNFTAVCTGDINACLVGPFVKASDPTVPCSSYASAKIECLETCEPVNVAEKALNQEFNLCAEGRFSVKSCSRTENSTCQSQAHDINRVCNSTRNCFVGFNSPERRRCDQVENFDFNCTVPCYTRNHARSYLNGFFSTTCEVGNARIRSCGSQAGINKCLDEKHDITRTCNSGDSCLTTFKDSQTNEACNRHGGVEFSCSTACGKMWSDGGAFQQLNNFFGECSRAEVSIQSCSTPMSNNCADKNYNLVTNCSTPNDCLESFTQTPGGAKCNRYKNLQMRCLGTFCKDVADLRGQLTRAFAETCITLSVGIKSCPERRTNCQNLSSSLDQRVHCYNVDGCLAHYRNPATNAACSQYEDSIIECIQTHGQVFPPIAIDPVDPPPSTTPVTTTTTTTAPVTAPTTASPRPTTPPPDTAAPTTSNPPTTPPPTPALPQTPAPPTPAPPQTPDTPTTVSTKRPSSVPSTTAPGRTTVSQSTSTTTTATTGTTATTAPGGGTGNAGQQAEGGDNPVQLQELLLVVCGCLVGIVLMLFIIIWMILKYRKKQRILTENAVYYDPGALQSQVPYAESATYRGGSVMGIGGKMADMEPIYMEVPGLAGEQDVLKYAPAEEDYLKVLSPPREPAPLPPKDTAPYNGKSAYDNYRRS